jgi:alpha-glucosidase
VTARAVPWWHDAVVYQLYVRSFADADGDGVGDLRGVIERLDHLADLGVDAIWLNPCYPSPQHDHGYDVADYLDIHPEYGTLDVFDELVAACRARSIKVLMDVVPNHCSSEHAWFRAAVAARPGSRERARFWFRDGRGDGGDEPPNNWIAYFGGPAWQRVTEADGTPGQWYLCTFTPSQPDLNWNDASVAAHFDDVLRFWFDRGVEGFRVDAVPTLGKHPDLPDTPPIPPGTPAPEAMGNNLLASHGEAGHQVWRRWRTLVDRYETDHPGRSLVMVAEAYAPDIETMRSYVRADELHQAFSFDLLLANWQAWRWRTAMRESIEHLAGVPLVFTLDNHDNQRSVTRYGRVDTHLDSGYTGSALIDTGAPVNVESGTMRARAASVALLALPGSIYLYQGEELGLPEVLDLDPDDRQDPIFLRTAGQQIGRDGCRVPLPWTTNPVGNHGFSLSVPAKAPWLPQPEWWGQWAADGQRSDPTSMLALHRTAIALRRSTIAGEFAWANELDDAADVVAFRRGEVLVVLNMGPSPVTLHALAPHRLVLTSRVEHTDPTVIPADTAAWLTPAAQ